MSQHGCPQPALPECTPENVLSAIDGLRSASFQLGPRTTLTTAPGGATFTLAVEEGFYSSDPSFRNRIDFPDDDTAIQRFIEDRLRTFGHNPKTESEKVEAWLAGEKRLVLAKELAGLMNALQNNFRPMSEAPLVIKEAQSVLYNDIVIGRNIIPKATKIAVFVEDGGKAGSVINFSCEIAVANNGVIPLRTQVVLDKFGTAIGIEFVFKYGERGRVCYMGLDGLLYKSDDVKPDSIDFANLHKAETPVKRVSSLFDYAVFGHAVYTLNRFFTEGHAVNPS